MVKKIFFYNEIEKIDKQKVLKSLNTNHFVILRGLFKKNQVIEVLNNLKKKIKFRNDKIRKKNQYDLIKSNYQRLMFGMSGGVRGLLNTNSRFIRTFYNPLWCEDIYKANKIFIKLTMLQNYFYNLDRYYGIKEKKTKHGLFVASRFQHYPAGGGFLSPHKDIAAIKTAKKLKINLFYNFLLLMTKKGKDYKEGGGFIVKNKKVFNYENICEYGDVVIYNSKTVHGVEDIDFSKYPDVKTKNGRYVALTTLFKW